MHNVLMIRVRPFDDCLMSGSGSNSIFIFLFYSRHCGNGFFAFVSSTVHNHPVDLNNMVMVCSVHNSVYFFFFFQSKHSTSISVMLPFANFKVGFRFNSLLKFHPFTQIHADKIQHIKVNGQQGFPQEFFLSANYPDRDGCARGYPTPACRKFLQV